ncbi:MAG: HAD family hydrolase [Phycisphaerae bacterium]|nr:HAD family hydrolase [Phycisphaerae bacterium]
MYNAVIFDLDGTLVNTLEDIANSVNAALHQHRLQSHPVTSYRLRVGDGTRALIERSLPTDRQDLVESVLKAQAAFYRDHFCDNSAPYPGISDLLTRLKAGHLKLAVLSNKPDVYTRTLTERLFPSGTFDLIQGHLEGVPLKPDPTSLVDMLSKLNVTPDQAMYVGDSGVDIQTGKRAGVYAVGVAWGFRGPEELELNGCDTLIHDPIELLHLLPGPKG